MHKPCCRALPPIGDFQSDASFMNPRPPESAFSQVPRRGNQTLTYSKPMSSPKRCQLFAGKRTLPSLAVVAILLFASSVSRAATASFDPSMPTPGANDISNLLGTGGTDYTNG